MDSALIVGILTFCASIISSFCSWYSIKVTERGNRENIAANRVLSQEVQLEENKRTENQIDANIVWSTRVNWIQQVRDLIAEFITVCYQYIQDPDTSTDEKLNLIEEKKLLLTLYFGPDNNTSYQQSASDILDPQTNNAKNTMIIALINTIHNQIKEYRYARHTLNICYIELARCSECEENNSDKKCFCEHNEYGDKFTKSDCLRCKANLQAQETKSYSVITELPANLELLSEAMRIYFKLEWNCAKNRMPKA